MTLSSRNICVRTAFVGDKVHLCHWLTHRQSALLTSEDLVISSAFIRQSSPRCKDESTMRETERHPTSPALGRRRCKGCVHTVGHRQLELENAIGPHIMYHVSCWRVVSQSAVRVGTGLRTSTVLVAPLRVLVPMLDDVHAWLSKD